MTDQQEIVSAQIDGTSRRPHSACLAGRNSMHSKGFSLVELLVVLAIGLVIAAFAIPTLTTTMDGVRLREALGNANNVAQRCRMMAVKKNFYQRLHFAPSGSHVALFVTDGDDVNVTPVNGDPKMSTQVWLTSQFSIPGAPSGAGAPPKLTTLQMWGSNGITLYTNQDPYFNSRGLPCTVGVGTVCTTTGGFIYYYRYQGVGNVRWAATSISPAGRIESWVWTGGNWSN